MENKYIQVTYCYCPVEGRAVAISYDGACLGASGRYPDGSWVEVSMARSRYLEVGRIPFTLPDGESGYIVTYRRVSAAAMRRSERAQMEAIAAAMSE